MAQINSIKFKPNHADKLWAAGWIIKKKHKVFSHTNWNGWMKSIQIQIEMVG